MGTAATAASGATVDAIVGCALICVTLRAAVPVPPPLLLVPWLALARSG